VTGGLEVALQCTFLVASQRARFADTHARLGVMPGGGITVLMAQSMGLRRAIELSLTGNFLTPTRRSGSGWSTTSCRTRSCCRSPGGWPPTSPETTRTPSAACSSTTARSPSAATLDEAHLIEGYLAETWRPGMTQVADRGRHGPRPRAGLRC
jgi:enoyl-CoA hydratase